jgi:hypothetical protein
MCVLTARFVKIKGNTEEMRRLSSQNVTDKPYRHGKER